MPAIQYSIEWNAILAASIVLERVKWTVSKLRSLYKEEIEEVKKFNPDLSRFLLFDPKYYSYITHINRLKKACGVPSGFNFLEESLLYQSGRKINYLRSLNPLEAKMISFKEIRPRSKALCFKSPSFDPTPKL